MVLATSLDFPPRFSVDILAVAELEFLVPTVTATFVGEFTVVFAVGVLPDPDESLLPFEFGFPVLDPPVLEPDLDLSLFQAQRVGESLSFGSDHVLRTFEYSFQSVELIGSEYRSYSLGFATAHVGCFPLQWVPLGRWRMRNRICNNKQDGSR